MVHSRKLAHAVGVASLSATLPLSICLSVSLFNLVFLLSSYYSFNRDQTIPLSPSSPPPYFLAPFSDPPPLLSQQ